MTTKELRQVLDWADEGRLQYNHRQNGWIEYSVEPPNLIISHEDFDRYRRKPEPTMRAWTSGDCAVFLNAIIRDKGIEGCGSRVLGFDDDGIETIEWEKHGLRLKLSHNSYGYIFDNQECSYDLGKTWKRCGVEE